MVQLFHLRTPPPNPSSWEEWTDRSLKNLNDFKAYGLRETTRPAKWVAKWVKIDPDFLVDWNWSKISAGSNSEVYHIKSYQKESRKIGCLVAARHNPSKYESQLGYVFFAMPSVAQFTDLSENVLSHGIPSFFRPFQWGNDDNALRTLRRSR